MSDLNGSATGGQPGADGAGGGEAPWFSAIQDEGLRGYVQTKGFKDAGALAESYRNFEKLQGVPQDRLLKLPEKDDDPAWSSIYSRLGRPEKAEDYGLKFDGDDAFAKRFAGVFHEANVTKGQAAKLNEAWNGYVAELLQQDEQARQTRDASEIQELRGKWGQQYDANVELGRRAGREFGLSDQEFEAISGSLGSGKTLELFNRIGAKLGEAPSFNPQGGQGGYGFGLTPEAARAQIQSKMSDKDWTAKYLSGDKSTAEEMTRLQKIAAGEA